jgi:hypothetical protein
MLLLKPDSDIVMMQSADSVSYFSMLRATSRISHAYCVAQNFHYTCHYGIIRGYHPWQACYNRIYMLANLIELGFRGWYIHLDADAWVQDTTYDLRRYFESLSETSFVFTPGGDGGIWDVNDGVFFANCAHPDTQEIVRSWKDRAMAISAEELRAASEWYQVHCDQRLLHEVLQQDGNRLCAAIHREDPRFFNGPGPGTRFIRQVLRVAYENPDKRWDQIELGAERALTLHAASTDEAIGTFCALARALNLPIPAEREAIRAIMSDTSSLKAFLRKTLAE